MKVRAPTAEELEPASLVDKYIRYGNKSTNEFVNDYHEETY